MKRAHARYIISSAWSHLRFKRPFLPSGDWIRLGGGIVLAAIIGAFVYHIDPRGTVLVNVGSFLGALLCLLPRHHTRVASALAGMLLVNGGAALGILLSGHSILTLCVLIVFLFAAGMARAVSVGGFMRLIFAAVALAAAGEMTTPVAGSQTVWAALAVFILGQIAVVVCGCIRRPLHGFVEQRETIAELYRQLTRFADGSDTHIIRARVLARESVELTPLLEFRQARWLRVLLDAADDVAANLSAGVRPEDRQALDWILAVLAGDNAPNLPADLDLSPGVSLAVEATRSGLNPTSHQRNLRNITPRATFRFYTRELKDVRGSTLRFAVRIALTGFFCQLLGEHVIADVGHGLPYHGFWTLLAGCLMAMPDYHGTIGKAIARTTGSILGAIVGTALSLIPFLQQPVPFLVVATLFIIAYLAARTVSQGALMLVVVAWLAFILGGEPAAFSRILDTLVGAAIATVVFFLLPTWNVDRIGELFRQWCERGRFAVIAVTAHAQFAGRMETPDEHRAFDDLVHAERRVVRAAQVVPLEPRSHEAPWPLDNLPLISDCLDRVATSLLQLHRSSGNTDSSVSTAASTLSPERGEAFAEAFGSLSVGRPANLAEPEPGVLHTLWLQLRELERLTVSEQ